MKAIILAGGEGTRLKPLTNTIPKPLIKIAGKPIIEHNLEHIYKYVSEIIIVIKYRGYQIKNYFGDNYKNTKIIYKEQGEEKGTGGAIKGINFNNDVLIINGDSIFEKKDIEKIIKSKNYGVLVKEVENPEKYGIFEIDENNNIQKIIEKPQKYVGNLANLGVYKFNSNIFENINQIKISKRGEYELTDALNLYLKNNSLTAIKVKGEFIDVGYVSDICKLNKINFNENFKNPILGDFYPLEEVNDFILGIGLPKSELESIVKYSNDKNDIALQKNTSDSKRFSSLETLEKWYYDEGRIIFSLISKKGEIAGFYQLRPAKFPNIIKVINEDFLSSIDKNNIHTSGIRIYPNFRGLKLAVPIIELGNNYYKIIHNNYYLSIDIETDNIGSQKSFEKAGFKLLGYGENKKTVSGSKINERIVYIKLM